MRHIHPYDHGYTHFLISESERGISATVVSIAGEDEIRINWSAIDIDYTPHYVRYKGRDVTTETREHLLRRPAAWVP